jgi:predicted nucleic-acid-binding protein
MIGVDTNLLVRLFTNDDKKQAKKVAELFEDNQIYISKSVLLETEWVLRYTYELDSAIIQEAFEKLCSLSQVIVEDVTCVLQATQWFKDDLDFADALHLASSKPHRQFATFDKKLIKKGKKLDPKFNFIEV